MNLITVFVSSAFAIICWELTPLKNQIRRRERVEEVKEFWTIGLDATNLSNYLGGNIRSGRYYVLLCRDPGTGDVRTLGKVKIAGLVDAAGKSTMYREDAAIKTINVSVENEELLKRIAKAKGMGNTVFELVYAPEGTEIPQGE